MSRVGTVCMLLHFISFFRKMVGYYPLLLHCILIHQLTWFKHESVTARQALELTQVCVCMLLWDKITDGQILSEHSSFSQGHAYTSRRHSQGEWFLKRMILTCALAHTACLKRQLFSAYCTIWLSTVR